MSCSTKMGAAGAQSAAYWAMWVNSSCAMTGDHLRTASRKAARKASEENSSTTSGRSERATECEPMRRTSTTSTKRSNSSGGGGASVSTKHTRI